MSGGSGDGGGTGSRANVFAINFIFICQESWIPGGLAAGRGGDHHCILAGVVSGVGSCKWEGTGQRILKFNTLFMTSFCCWHLPLGKRH